MLDRLTGLVSVCLNPLLMSALAVGLVATGTGAPTEEVWAVFGLSIMFMFAIPVFYLFALRRSRRIDEISFQDRMQRRWPMIISIVLMIILYPSLLAVTETTASAVLSVAGIYLVNMVLLLLITVRYRISLHAAGLASFISVCSVFGAISTFDGIPGGASVLLTATAALPLITWARIRRGDQETGEALAGIVFGLTVPALELALLILLGVL